ncbi:MULTISPECIES: hypothetical protein [unclassified Methylobacterium]|uniref:hypothetical protein n=1 Tax=unclassified Methylobacterium TaxID=2615210 RepID=UPI0006F3CAD2|nr:MULTISPECIES: hypothetical protein [unclassified Methylobacterium]KQO53564.1 hypothetical protein ASF24_04275 [Methylobacterium sp. Leaf86]KQO99047.1 hypothetical protein ASF32_14415 [Methylobacterium sp. Leaf91]MBO1020671.1 hypothetical protein [Methylobacterium sp. SD274]
MAPSAALRMVRHDDLIRASQAAGRAFSPIEDGADDGSTASSKFLALSAVSLAGFLASFGAFLFFV